MTPLLSVCLITYNHINYIEHAIEGVLMQRVNFSWELVIADDFSTDGTREVIQKYKKKYPDFIKLILQDSNVGAAQNWIDLITYPASKYIAYFEGDDYWTDPLKLQRQVDFLEANSEFVICFHKIKIEKGQALLADYITQVPAETTILKDLLANNYIHTVSAVFRNVLSTLPPWFKTALPGDHPLWILLTSNEGKIKYMDEVMAVYRVHDNGVWNTQRANNKYAQKISLTFLNCAREIDTYNEPFLKWVIFSLAQSVYLKGYDSFTRKEYLSHVHWAMKRTKLTQREKLSVLNPMFRRFKEKMLKKFKGQGPDV